MTERLEKRAANRCAFDALYWISVLITALALLLAACGPDAVAALPPDAPLIDRLGAVVDREIIGADVYATTYDPAIRTVSTVFGLGSYNLSMTEWKILEITCAWRDLRQWDGWRFQFTGRITVVDALGNTSNVDGLRVILPPESIAGLNCALTASLRLQPIAELYEKHRLLE